MAVLMMGVAGISCKKYLDKKPQQNLVIPKSLADLQAILDFHSVMNESGVDLPEFLSDNIYVSDADYASGRVEERLNYVWDRQAMHLNSWRSPYRVVYYANFVLDALPMVAVNESEKNLYDQIKGAALFHRSFAFFEVAQLYCKPWSETAATDPGIVLRQTAAIQAPSERATVQQTYDKLVADLNTAIELLPGTREAFTRPGKATAHALLARVYLSMRAYEKAGIHARESLKINDALLDYNSLLPAGSPAMPPANPEINFFNRVQGQVRLMNPPRAKIDTVLLNMYQPGDLRKELYFRKNDDDSYSFAGSYASLYWEAIGFDGLATDEMYLVSAESYARAGNIPDALADLNALLEKRYQTGMFTPVATNDAGQALQIILAERRKELVFRGQRWSDLRRLNLEGTNITLKRRIDGADYLLPPGDLRWVMLIPLEIITMSNIPQNPR